jgi:hypothetical protein
MNDQVEPSACFVLAKKHFTAPGDYFSRASRHLSQFVGPQSTEQRCSRDQGSERTALWRSCHLMLRAMVLTTIPAAGADHQTNQAGGFQPAIAPW